MKLRLSLFIVAFIDTMNISAQSEKLLYEKNWEGETAFVGWYQGGIVPTLVNEGIAITNPLREDQIWYPQMYVSEECLTLEDGHDYIVRLNLRVPSDGTYQVYIGNWASYILCQVLVTYSEDFQTIDAVFPKTDGNVRGDGVIILQCGWVVGTTILKKVQLIEKSYGDETAITIVNASNTDGQMYNLAGQKVSASYKGIVIQNGKKRVKRFHE